MSIRHETIEKNAILMLVLTLITVSIGGLVQIIPLFTVETTIERIDGVRPYTPLELMGRNIYIREGCYLCHSQQIRPFKDEVERYGHYSLAAESMYDKPFQWGSKRTGPDLARVGGKYSDEWHRLHMEDPRSVVPESVMPGYPFLAKTPLEVSKEASQDAVSTVGRMFRGVRPQLKLTFPLALVGRCILNEMIDSTEPAYVGGIIEGLMLEEGDKDKKREVQYKEMFKPLLDFTKEYLGKKVEKVQISKHLVQSPVVVLSADYGWTAQMEKVMKSQAFADQSKFEFMKSKRMFEINPRHP